MRALLERITRNWSLKLAALGIALLLWSLVKAEEQISINVPNVPVSVTVRDPAWELAAPPVPGRLTVQVSGAVRDLFRLAIARPRVVIPVETVRDSVQVVVVSPGWVHLAGENVGPIRVDDIHPATVRLVFDPIASRYVPVVLPIRGELPGGLQLSGPLTVEPRFVRASGPRRRLLRLDTIRLPAFDLGHLTDTTTVGVDIDTAALGVAVFPGTVRVRIPVAPAPPPAPPGPADSLHADSARRDSTLGTRPPGAH